MHKHPIIAQGTREKNRRKKEHVQIHLMQKIDKDASVAVSNTYEKQYAGTQALGHEVLQSLRPYNY